MILFFLLYISMIVYGNSNQINEEHIKSILTSHYSEIKDIFEYMKYDDLFHDETILFVIPQFTMNNVFISINEIDEINIKLKDLNPSLRKEIPRIQNLRVVRNLIVELKNFEMEINIKIKSSYISEGQNSLDISVLGNPIINYSPYVISNYNEMKEKFNSLIKSGEFNNIYILPIINKIINKIIGTIIES